MTQEQKHLLLVDLCARLPYEIKCYYNSPEIDDNVSEGISVIKGFQNEGILVEIESGDVIDIDYIKPYLRPMSSMTEEEKIELCTRAYAPDEMKPLDEKLYVIQTNANNATDFYNEHHFDYRGLIEKGLALEAPEDMYK